MLMMVFSLLPQGLSEQQQPVGGAVEPWVCGQEGKRASSGLSGSPFELTAAGFLQGKSWQRTPKVQPSPI